MDTTTTIVIVIVAVMLILVLLAFAILRKQRQGPGLKDRFGEEYERTVSRSGDRDAAEADLQRRLDRREEVEVVNLSDEDRLRYRANWFELQKGFVDQPREAVIEADGLITEVMRVRGYPVDDFDRRTDDLSVDHPDIVKHYRSGHGIAERSRDGLAGTEELREAVLDYRTLFERLVGTEETAS